MLLSASSYWYLLASHAPSVPAATVRAAVHANAAPSVARAISVNNNALVTGRTASLSVLGQDDGGESKLVYTWSVTAAPAGGTAAFNVNGSNAAKNATATFTRAGTYNLTVRIVDAGGLSVSNSKTFVVSPTLTSVYVSTATGQVVNPGSTLVVPGVSQTIVAQGLDQFGNVLATQPTFSWSLTTVASGAPTPTLASRGASATVTFAQAGAYGVTVRAQAAGRITVLRSVSMNVTQVLSAINVSPNVASVLQGSQQQFTAQALDQFRRPMLAQPAFAWSSSAGTISAAGLFTAPSNASGCTVTAASGLVRGTATVVVASSSLNFLNLQNSTLATLVQNLDADGSLSRQDMIQILRGVGADGVVDATEFGDLKTVLLQATALNIPAYVQVLAGDVVNGNLANATFQGQPLGNLAAGSTASQLNKLVDKWFLGADHPTLCNTSLVYRSAAGSLFPHTPSHTDEFQGQLGDCYFISALGTLADSNPAAVQNMFIDNGDGTFTVRFYTGTYGTIYNYSDGSISAGFRNNVGTADYVTVDRMLPTTSSGMLAYADYGANYANSANSLWIPLAEKAYAQWNETGKEGRDGLNAYASIQGGWMATVDAQVLGYNATDYIMTNTSKQVAVNALAARKAVTIGTLQWSGTYLGLYASHAYAITGYNASTDTFTLYNPWGTNQPGPLTWSQLQSATSQMAIADTSGSLPISAAMAPLGAPRTASLHQAAGAGDASRRLFAMLENNALLDWQQVSGAKAAHRELPASLVDATFAAANLALHNGALPLLG